MQTDALTPPLPADQARVPCDQARVTCYEALLTMSLQLRRHIEAVADQFGLTPPQARVLMSLAGPTRMQDVAETNACEPSHVTGIAAQLEAAGLVRREPDPDDRRARRLSVTQEGERVRQRLIPALVEGAPVIADLGDDAVRSLAHLLGAGGLPAPAI